MTSSRLALEGSINWAFVGQLIGASLALAALAAAIVIGYQLWREGRDR